MALISDGIDNVRAFELPAGIWADGESISAPRVALVRWYSSYSDKFYQVYVNGRYAGATVDSQQRQMFVPMPTSLETAVRIEVFAVEAGEAHIDFGGEIDSGSGQTGRVRISLLRGQNLPINSSIEVYSDNGTGQIDYDNPLTHSALPAWPVWQDKAGFGMSRFGASDFGYDSAAAAGFGKGSFGQGQFGLDADAFEWVSRYLQAGVYKFGVRISDKAGNESDNETDPITVIPAAKPAEDVSVSSFNKQTNQLVLNVS